MRISDWSSDVCSSDLLHVVLGGFQPGAPLRLVHRTESLVRDWRNAQELPQLHAVAAGVHRAHVGKRARRCGTASLVLDVIEIGKHSSREGVCQYGSTQGVRVYLNKK